MDASNTASTTRATALNVLAGVGFAALVGGSFWLAFYSTRFVPEIINRVGSASVYLSSFFSPAPATVSIVPTPAAPTTLPFATPATTAEPAAATMPAAKIPTPPKPAATATGPETTATYPMSGASSSPTLSGLPDLVVNITAVGYLTSTSTDSFVASSTVPFGNRPAAKFTIKNIGANIAAPWRFSASIPTQSAYIFQSPLQQSLAPGESIDYVLGFDQANKGSGQMISITANFDKAVSESNADNNSASAYLTILGS
ncbi:hypothetical protein KGM48_00940 [Patescibacteria group bacterium]|nr:hypothetical protein [Patescibacteria group bacterium]